MNDAETKLLAYVGRGFGAEAIVTLRDKRAVKFVRGQARAVPTGDASDLMAGSPGQFALAETMAETAKRHSIKADRLEKLKNLHTATFTKRGEEPLAVVIVDAQTEEAINAEKERAAKAKEKE
jgi:hypothetical protein